MNSSVTKAIFLFLHSEPRNANNEKEMPKSEMINFVLSIEIERK